MNIYVAGALGIAWIVSLVAADSFGSTRARNADKAAQDDAVIEAVAEYDAIAQHDKALAVANAQKESKARTEANSIRAQANESIAANRLPVGCDWDSVSYGLLVDAVHSANAETPAPERMPANVRLTPPASQQPRGFRAVVPD